MSTFSEEDKMLLYIIRATAKELGGSWHDCTTIFNELASKPRSQDGLTTAYQSFKRGQKIDELKVGARDAKWCATKQHVEEQLLKKKDACSGDLMPRSGRPENEDSGGIVCPVPRRAPTLPWTGWSGANAGMDFDVQAAFFPQQVALSDEQPWAADGCVSNEALSPVQTGEHPFAAPVYGTVYEAVDNKPICGMDSSATYNAGDWAGWGADNACLYGDGTYMYGNGTCIYGTGATYMNAVDSTAGTTIGSGWSPSCNTAVESYSTTTTTTPMITPMITSVTTPMTTPMATPGNQSCYVSNGPGAGTFSCTASSLADYGPILIESPSDSWLSGQVVPANTHPQGLDAESTSITNTSTWQETEGLMSSDELNSVLERYKGEIYTI